MTSERFRQLPSDETVHAYVQDGAMRQYIETMALRIPEFAEGLAGWIDAVAQVRGPRSLAARRWRSRAGGVGPAAAPYVYDVPPALAALAADSPGLAPSRYLVSLGALPDVPAEASLELVPGRVHLFVFPSAPLARVALGDAESLRAEDDGTWSVSTALELGTLDVRVETADGRVFREALELALAPG